MRKRPGAGLARLEAEVQKRRASELELVNKLASINEEVRLERNRRMGSETELEAQRSQLREISSGLDAVKSENRRLSEKNVELTHKLLVFKSDTAVDDKFIDLEDEMHRLKMHNEHLNQKVKELNDDVKNTTYRERSLSKENSDLKTKIKNEEIAKIKRSSIVTGSPKKELDQASLPPRADKGANIEVQKPSVDYGPVHDLKLKNVTMQNEINTLKNKIKEMETRRNEISQ
jgi:chromosome segregation ATPase